MKKLFMLMTMCMITLLSIGQIPDAFKYQTIIRDKTGNIIKNQKVQFQISILENTSVGTAVYVETDTVTTNYYGIASFEIGNGKVVTGDFKTIDWINGKHFVKIMVDISGGANFVFMGTSELLSVPYAIVSGNGVNSEDIKCNMENIGKIRYSELKNTIQYCNGSYWITFSSISTPAINLTLFGTNASGQGKTDGSVDLTISGGSSPYSISWSNGATTEDISGLAVGKYTVTVTDYDGKTATKDIDILVTFKCGDTLTDMRDGKKYRTVKIGNQCFMAENLKYTTGLTCGNSDLSWTTSPRYYSYSRTGTNDLEPDPVLYNWNAAMNGASSSNSNPSGVKGLCPDDWHLPSDAEWYVLNNWLKINGNGGSGTESGTKMKTLNSTSGFDGLFSGHYLTNTIEYKDSKTGYQCSTEKSSTGVWIWGIHLGTDYYRYSSIVKEAGMSIRCIKN